MAELFFEIASHSFILKEQGNPEWKIQNKTNSLNFPAEFPRFQVKRIGISKDVMSFFILYLYTPWKTTTITEVK